jgi:glycosyltransferase involved in cell wall biosynthesis
MRLCCYTCTALPKIGGQEVVIDCLARRFVRRGHEVVVLSPRLRDHESYQPASLPYATVWHPRYRSTRWFVAWYGRWLARLHGQHHFDLLHCHDVYPSAYVAACCPAVSALPMVVTSHGVDLDCAGLLARKPRLQGRYEQALRRADAAVAISPATHERFHAVYPPCRIESIPNGVDVAQLALPVPRPAELHPAIRAGKYVLFLGRLVHRKGIDLLLDAFAAAGHGSDVELVIAGEGPERAALEAQAVRVGLGGRARFVGRVEGDARTWLLQHSLCLVVASRIAEAFGLVVLESGAAGRPSIATQLPGLEGLIDPERTGWLVPPESVSELSNTLRRAIAEPELLDRLGSTARRMAQQYDWDRIADRYLDLFAELVEKARRRAAA